jgi:thiosulfate reductase cytochrome b subunit
VTSWYWVDGERRDPVELARVQEASGAISSGSEVGSVERVEEELRRLGVADPRIVGEVQPYPIHHGVAGGEWATRDCQVCHDQDSRMGRAMRLGPAAPGGIRPDLVANAGVAMAGVVSLEEDGSVSYRPLTREAGFYVLGHDSAPWAHLIGISVLLLTLAGVTAHGALRWWAGREQTADTPRDTGPPVYMYSAYERVWHWLQALAILLLMVTGIEIHVTRTGIMDFALAVRAHNILGFIVIANAAFAALYHLASGEIRQYLPRPQGFFGQAIAQARFYLSGMFRAEGHPFEKRPDRKLNPLQQLTYLVILNLLLPLQVVTGLLMWGAQEWPIVDRAFGGLAVLAPIHTLGAWMFAAFLLMHVYLTTTGPTPTANLQAMILGWEGAEPAEAGRETP